MYTYLPFLSETKPNPLILIGEVILSLWFFFASLCWFHFFVVLFCRSYSSFPFNSTFTSTHLRCHHGSFIVYHLFLSYSSLFSFTALFTHVRNGRCCYRRAWGWRWDLTLRLPLLFPQPLLCVLFYSYAWFVPLRALALPIPLILSLE